MNLQTMTKQRRMITIRFMGEHNLTLNQRNMEYAKRTNGDKYLKCIKDVD